MHKIAQHICRQIRYWCPRVSNRAATETALARFYATRADYHAMTADADKTTHPQVRLLLDSLRLNHVCVEFGCGGGVVLAAVAPQAQRLVGLDVAPLALQTARRRECAAAVMTVQGDVNYAPLRSACADVVYSFEVMEHVWNPEAMLLEMIRVLKPGGRLFLSLPNGFSLDLHLRKRRIVRVLDKFGAACAWFRNLIRPRMFDNTEPDLNCLSVYPDCDMITKVFPASLRSFLKRQGCHVERLETFYFQCDKAKEAAAVDRYRRLDQHPFYRHFGDHILLVARKIS